MSKGRAAGDGTGKVMPPKEQGLSHYGGDTSDAPKTPQSGPTIIEGRTTPLKGAGSK